MARRRLNEVYNNISDKLVTDTLYDICNEHHLIAKSTDSSLGYLWYMYTHGTKKGELKPFILLAEINLLEATGFITDDSKETMIGQLKSSDKENLYMLFLAINSLRNERIKKLGNFCIDNINYKSIDYKTNIINVDSFLKSKNV